MGRLFGTDGVRGIANKELTGELAYKIGRAGAYFLASQYQLEEKPMIFIGKDTRLSGDMLEAALTAGITSVGVDVVRLGIVPTPGVAYLTSKYSVIGGVMISASHNPIADNGIKFFNQSGFKLTDEMEIEIEDLILNNYEVIPVPTHAEIGKVSCKEDLVQNYIDYLVGVAEQDFSGLKIVLDCANGAAFRVAPEVFKRLGADLVVLNDCPDGNKINVDCGSTHPEVIAEEVIKEKADLGIAHDGDADRVIVVDEQGKIVDGDQIMAVLALDFLKKGKLRGQTLVTTAYSNLGLKEAVKAAGGKVEIADNGDRYVLKKMLANNYSLGGEKSGHIIILDYNKTGDGVLTALKLTEIIKETKKSLNELAAQMKPWPQILANVRVRYKESWETNKKIEEKIKRAEQELGDEGRIFVRASGTEPIIRIMVEGKDEELLRELEQDLVNMVKSELND